MQHPKIKRLLLQVSYISFKPESIFWYLHISVSYLFRSLGSVVGISLGSTVVQNVLRVYLRRRLSDVDIDVDEVGYMFLQLSWFFSDLDYEFHQIARSVRSSLSSIDELDPSIRTIVRGSYEEAIQAAFWLALAFSIAGTISSFFVREKPLRQRA